MQLSLPYWVKTEIIKRLKHYMGNLIHTLPKVELFMSILLQLCHADISHSQFQQFWITVYDARLEEKF